MSGGQPVIFLSAAEASGDRLAAGLIRQVKDLIPGARFTGAAGPEMKGEDCESIIDLTETATMLGGVFGKIFYYRRVIRKLRSAIRDIRPDVVVPVDSPALNWHIAAEATSLGIPVVHYVAPQVWAWAAWRIRKLRRLTDHVACLLPFEERYFRERGVPATFVGHPLSDRVRNSFTENRFPALDEAWIDGSWHIALLPGSRAGEIAAIAPALSKVADALTAGRPGTRCVFAAADDISAERITGATGRDDLQIAVGEVETVLARSHFAVVASGTASLQVASHGVPMIVVYNIPLWQKVAWHTVVKRLVRTRYLSLVNILAGRGVVPELMPYFSSPRQIVALAERLLNDYGWLYATRKKLIDLASSLRSPGGTAAENTAHIIVDRIGRGDDSLPEV